MAKRRSGTEGGPWHAIVARYCGGEKVIDRVARLLESLGVEPTDDPRQLLQYARRAYQKATTRSERQALSLFVKSLQQHLPFVPITELETGILRVESGIATLDKLFAGLDAEMRPILGLPISGVKVELYGPHGSGKTWIALAFSVLAALNDHPVYYIDTEGAVELPRVLRMALMIGRNLGLSPQDVRRKLSEHFMYRRLADARLSELTSALQTIADAGPGVVVVDSFTAALDKEFSLDMKQMRDRLPQRATAIARYLAELDRLAASNFTVIQTMQVSTKPATDSVADVLKREYLKGGEKVKHYGYYVIAVVKVLTERGSYIAYVVDDGPIASQIWGVLKITLRGLEDVPCEEASQLTDVVSQLARIKPEYLANCLSVEQLLGIEGLETGARQGEGSQ